MSRSTPSLQATEAFLMAARLGSFERAATELSISASALSRRIQWLEDFVGAPLFDRSGRVRHLTALGHQYRGELEPALEAIFRATAKLRQQQTTNKIRLITSHAFALNWLMPRIADLFSSLGIDIELSIGRGSHHLRSGEVDLAIWGGVDDAAGYPSDMLMELEAVPVSASRPIGGYANPRSLRDLATQRLLLPRTTPQLWHNWFAAAGYAGPVPERFAEVDNTHFCYESAASGLGVALAIPLLGDRMIGDARVRACLPIRAKVPIRYRLIYAQAGLPRRSDIAAFRQWLTGEISYSVKAFYDWSSACVAS